MAKLFHFVRVISLCNLLRINLLQSPIFRCSTAPASSTGRKRWDSAPMNIPCATSTEIIGPSRTIERILPEDRRKDIQPVMDKTALILSARIKVSESYRDSTRAYSVKSNPYCLKTESTRLKSISSRRQAAISIIT